MSSISVALLRGINVGGNNLVSMASLQHSFEQLGLGAVRTYLNTGNVLFRHDGNAAALEREIDDMLSREYGVGSKTVVRRDVDIRRLVSAIDRFWTPDPRWKCNVIFLRRHLDAKNLLAGVSLKPGIEHAMAWPGTLVWSARIDALSRTAMMRFGRSPAYQDATVRSVATTRTIAAMMRQLKGGRAARDRAR